MSIENIIALKKIGNVALNSGSYSEALKHYNSAIDLFIPNFNAQDKDGLANNWQNNNSSNAQLEARLYSKRSVAFLKLCQYYYAFKDAQQIVDISPEWFKGMAPWSNGLC